MTIEQEIVFLVRTTRSGVKVVEYNGVGLADGISAKKNRCYFYGDDAESAATEYARRKADKQQEDARVVGLGDRL